MPIGPDIAAPPAHAPVSAPGGLVTADAGAWSERRLAILSELAEAGLEIALALKTRIVETAAAEPDPASARACADLAQAFDRASRAVRMSLALRERLLKDGAFGKAAARTAAPEARAQRAERVQRIVGRVVKAGYKEGPLRDILERQARERLFDPDITGELLDRPIGELVARICADLGLSPDWLALAREAWAQAEITERPAGSPYAAWPDLPPEDPDPEDPDEDLEGEDDWEDPGGGGLGEIAP